MRSVMLVCVHCDSVFVSVAFTNRASLMKQMCSKAQPLATMHNGRCLSQSCTRGPGCWQERTAAQARAASALSVTRPRTATISRLSAFQAHMSNGSRSGLQAAWKMTRPVPAEWCKECISVVRAWPSPWFVCVCVSRVLTAEQHPACLVQHGLVPLKRFHRLVRRRVVRDEKPAWENHGRQTRHDEILQHGQSLRRGDLHASGHQLQMRRHAASSRQNVTDDDAWSQRENNTRHTSLLNGNVAQRERNERNTLCLDCPRRRWRAPKTGRAAPSCCPPWRPTSRTGRQSRCMNSAQNRRCGGTTCLGSSGMSSASTSHT